MSDDAPAEERYDVAVVGCGPAGCAAAIFTARYGLDTVVFDRGASSLERCAFLENYPGFPAGIDVETFSDLLCDHVETAGSTLVRELVESVERGAAVEDGTDVGYLLTTQAGRTVHAERVVAATRCGADYLRPVADAAFATREHGGESREQFDPAFADADGRTPVEGLYVASPAGERDVQAVVAAGQGAHVARRLIADDRAEDGYPGQVAERYDWLRPDAAFTGEHADRDYWRARFDARVPDDHDVPEARLDALREAQVDRVFEARRTEAVVERSTARGHRSLAAALDPEPVLDAIDDDTIRAYLDRRDHADARTGDASSGTGGDDSRTDGDDARRD